MPNSFQICVPVLDVYAKPSETSEVVSQALYGWKVESVDECQDFQRIQTSDGYQGWAKRQEMRRFPTHTSHHGKKVKTIYPAVPVYSAPHVKQKPLQMFPFEVQFTVLLELAEEEGRWIQVGLLEGLTGWVQRGHVQFESLPLTLNQMLQMSRQFLGIPYLWGGVSSFGYDCSGFIQMLWRQREVALPRDARQQCHEAAGIPVAWDSLESGDLLFYGSSEEDIQHVALYLGQQSLIHASVKPIPIVQISHLDERSLSQRFPYRKAKRLFLKERGAPC